MELVSQVSNAVVVAIKGEFDAVSVTDVRPMLEDLVATSTAHLVIDMSGVTFLDSSGIGCIVFMFKRLHAAKRTLVLAGLKEQPQRLIAMLRIDRAVSTSETVETALAALGA
jgi:anti-sigma B factor antagonist